MQSRPGRARSPRAHGRVKERNVDEQRREDRERGRHEAVSQEQDAGDDLEREHHGEIVRGKHGTDELARGAGWRRRRAEVQKAIEAEDQEREAQQDPGDEDDSFNRKKYSGVNHRTACAPSPRSRGDGDARDEPR